jgi:hypothetical protein
MPPAQQGLPHTNPIATVSNVPLKANFKTNITGNFILTHPLLSLHLPQISVRFP